MHAEAAAAAEYLPAVHSMHAGDPTAPANLPASQFVHVVAPDSPVRVEYFPTPQSVHTLAVAPENFPPAQSEHASSPAVYANLPASQSVHVVAPAASFWVKYFPTPQSVHALAFAPENFPAAHSEHSGDPAAPANLPS